MQTVGHSWYQNCRFFANTVLVLHSGLMGTAFMNDAMTCVYTHMNITLVWHVKNLLDSNGIECVVRNEHLIGAAGELSPIDTWPEVWVNNEDVNRSQIILKQLDETSSDEPWFCEVCSEELPPQFSACWRCETLRPNES